MLNRDRAPYRTGMKNAATKISCLPICFALRYRDIDGGAPHRHGAGGCGGSDAQFRTGKLPAMLTRAGYPTVAAALDEALVAGKLCEVERRAHAMLRP